MTARVPVLDQAVVDAELGRLWDFGRKFPHPDGGGAWLDADGEPDLSRPVHTYITARMTHVYCLAALRGQDGAAALALRGLDGLTGRLRDRRHGGWFDSLDPTGQPAPLKTNYSHAFVVLAASSAVVAGLPGASALLHEALDTWLARFWDDKAAMFVDTWNREFTRLDPYRGVNGNMHAVEALLAAADVLDDDTLRQRAAAVARRVAFGFAEPNGWRIPEHFTAEWQPRLGYNRDRPDDQFRPYGATVGHGFEWSRLLLTLEAAGTDPAPDLVRAATALFERAAADGWDVDGTPGFVYTTDWDGTPVARDRLHWVAAEAIAACAALYDRTADPSFRHRARQWWDYTAAVLLDHDRGSWHHQLDPRNRPVDTVWPGKPDLYHSVQALLILGLPLHPTVSLALQAQQPH